MTNHTTSLTQVSTSLISLVIDNIIVHKVLMYGGTLIVVTIVILPSNSTTSNPN
jgi:hypothetical protein